MSLMSDPVLFVASLIGPAFPVGAVVILEVDDSIARTRPRPREHVVNGDVTAETYGRE